MRSAVGRADVVAVDRRYYQPNFTPAEHAAIDQETQAVAEHFGYRGASTRSSHAA